MKQIKIGNELIPAISVVGGTIRQLGSQRNCIEITMESDYETVKNLFVDNVKYSILETVQTEYSIQTTDESGTVVETPQTTTTTEETDKSAYCLSGEIVDHRDGKITIYMCQLTAIENLLVSFYGGEE